MRFLFEGRGGEGRTWHSRLEFSSLTDQVCSYLIAGPWFQILQYMTIYILHINIIPITNIIQHMALIHGMYVIPLACQIDHLEFPSYYMAQLVIMRCRISRSVIITKIVTIDQVCHS